MSLLVEQFAYKSAPPARRAELTVGTAFIIVAILVMFTMADDGGLAWTAGWKYLPGAVGVFIWFRGRYLRKWQDEDSTESSD